MKRMFACLIIGIATVSASVGVPALAHVAESADLETAFGPSWIDGPESRGEKVVIRVDPADLMENIGSYIDGAGMCVNTSVETNLRAVGLDGWRGFRDYWARAERGGSWPEQLDRHLATYAKKNGIPPLQYVQYTGPHPEQVLELCERTGRPACIAYGYSPRYDSAINHMVFAPKPGTGQTLAAIADNNVFGGVTRDEAKRYEWMGRKGNDELVARMKTQADRWGRPVTSDAWVFVCVEPPPAPSPKLFPN